MVLPSPTFLPNAGEQTRLQITYGREPAAWNLKGVPCGGAPHRCLAETGFAEIPAIIEAFSARIRAECLNASWFLSLADARDRIEAWWVDYNTERPHSALGHLTPEEFARPAQTARKVSYA
jgi:transposase InsO family protein